jgi:hypothetical protein
VCNLQDQQVGQRISECTCRGRVFSSVFCLASANLSTSASASAFAGYSMLTRDAFACVVFSTTITTKPNFYKLPAIDKTAASALIRPDFLCCSLEALKTAVALASVAVLLVW